MFQTIEYEGFTATLEGEVLTITKDGESREYDIKEKNSGIKYEYRSPYFKIQTSDDFYYQFKFEEPNGFIGDIYDDEDVFIKEFACFTFGE
jgi:maltose-binding protein MalE